MQSLRAETRSLYRADTRDVGRWQHRKLVHWKPGSQSSGLVEQRRPEMKAPSNQQGELWAKRKKIHGRGLYGLVPAELKGCAGRVSSWSPLVLSELCGLSLLNPKEQVPRSQTPRPDDLACKSTCQQAWQSEFKSRGPTEWTYSSFQSSDCHRHTMCPSHTYI